MGVNSCGQLLIDEGNFFNTGLLNWDTTAKTANFTAVNGNGYFVNTTSGAITVTLPAGSAGDFIGVSDYASTSNTNKITISPNGTDKINGVNDDYVMSVNGIAVSLLYVDSTRGWKAVASNSEDISGGAFITATGGTITTDGNFKVHTFTGPGTFAISQTASLPSNNGLTYLVIGGGGGAGCNGGGGGGAGGVVTCCATASTGSFPVTVGSGGTGAPDGNSAGTSGSNSILSCISSSALGGGGGASRDGGPAAQPGGSGGGGGGGPGKEPSGTGTPGQGNPGGTGRNNGGSSAGGGGGGYCTAGSPSPGCRNGGAGGDGYISTITGSPVGYAGGGAGSGLDYNNFGGNSGPVQAGSGGGGPDNGCEDGRANSGGGGGGIGDGTNTFSNGGGNGGSGVVIIRYKFQ